MTLFQTALILAAFLCSLVAGFLFAFAVVVMPGIGRLNDRQFLRAFQVMDRVIQNNQPGFMLVWVGSVVTVIAASALGVRELNGMELVLLVITAACYLFGVQLPTFTMNIPLNNQLQTLDLELMSELALKEAREEFEPRWNRWNVFRTFFSSLAAMLLLLLMFRL